METQRYLVGNIDASAGVDQRPSDLFMPFEHSFYERGVPNLRTITITISSDLLGCNTLENSEGR